ncbi:hypothetical protein ID866_4692 [Astraeus odoratus]|nr:hypothetical protein ID866_4692 [Astraeus odoratus]
MKTTPPTIGPPPGFPTVQAKAVRNVPDGRLAAAALTVLLYDCLSTLVDEVRYIWPWGLHSALSSPHMLNFRRMRARYTFKWLYLFLRYIPLAAQM